MSPFRRALWIGAVLVGGSGWAAAPALGGRGSAHRTDSQNRRAAIRDERRLLAELHLPQGASRSGHEPNGDAHHLSRAPASQAGNFVREHQWWIVPGRPQAVLAYVEAHPPAQGKKDMGGQAGQCQPGQFPPQHCRTYLRFVGFSFPAVRNVLGTRWLLVEVTQLRDGRTGLRADAQVQWLITRPARERVPSGVHVVDVVRSRPGQGPSVDRRLTSPSQIRRVIRITDRLPVLQPGAWSCPADTGGGQTVTVSFRGTATGPALARASVPAGVGGTNTGCDAVSFWIGRHRETPLVRARHFLEQVGHVLGVDLAERPQSRGSTPRRP